MLDALTWRVMEEVDNTLLRGVEEGSGHGVVLSISTEKLKKQERVRSGREGWGNVPERRQLWAGRTSKDPWVSTLPALEGINCEVQCPKPSRVLSPC